MIDVLNSCYLFTFFYKFFFLQQETEKSTKTHKMHLENNITLVKIYLKATLLVLCRHFLGITFEPKLISTWCLYQNFQYQCPYQVEKEFEFGIELGW